MRPIAIASVVVAIVAAAAYAGPKMYWYYNQVSLIQAQMTEADSRLERLSAAIETSAPPERYTFNADGLGNDTHGQYL